MSPGYLFILISWIVSVVLLFIVVPRSRIREYLAVFLCFQALTWLTSIILTSFDMLSSPVRLFDRATKISFTSEFIVYPTVAVVFHRWFPSREGKMRVFFHYMLFVGGISLYTLVGKFTGVMSFKMEYLFRYAFNFTFELWVCRRYIVWLMGNTKLQYNGGASEWK